MSIPRICLRALPKVLTCGFIVAATLGSSAALAQLELAPAASEERATKSKSPFPRIVARSLLSTELAIPTTGTLRASIADAGSHLRDPGAAPTVRIILRDETGAVLHSRRQPVEPDHPTNLRLAPQLKASSSSVRKSDLPTAGHKIRVEVLVETDDILRIDHCPMTLTLTTGDAAADPSNTCGGDPCCDECGPTGRSGVYPSCASMDWFEY